MNLCEKNQGMVPTQCVKFKNFLPYVYRGCHRHSNQKKKMMNNNKSLVS